MLSGKKFEEKGAVKVLPCDDHQRATREFSNSFIPRRCIFIQPSPDALKACWCLRGYLDPDVMELVGSGATQTTTVSQLGRMLTVQMIGRNFRALELGDIRGKFSAADYLARRQGPLFAHLPLGSVLVFTADAVILILGSIY